MPVDSFEALSIQRNGSMTGNCAAYQADKKHSRRAPDQRDGRHLLGPGLSRLWREGDAGSSPLGCGHGRSAHCVAVL
jgi:hypothetical protein